MKTSPAPILTFCALVTLFFLTSCSSLDSTALFEPNIFFSTDAEVMVQAEEDNYEINESEETLAEELTALDQSGQWNSSHVPLGPEILPQPGPEKQAIQYDFPVVVNKQVETYIKLFQTKQRKYVARWLARSGRYLPYIQRELREAGLPSDLAYLAMIESGFNPQAYSRSRAAGMWQFIAGTGRNYGLQINDWVDERRNIEKSTKAAVRYLSRLHDEFDDWYLSVAAYNAGEGKIARGIKKYNTVDFWELAGEQYLMPETKRYVPKLIAAIIIAKEPHKYGFGDVVLHEPLAYDMVKVPGRTDLQAIAVCAEASVESLRQLNNELRKNQTPPQVSDYSLKVPKGTGSLVAANLQRLHPVITTDFKSHTIAKDDTLTTICRKYDLNKTTLLKANNLRSARLEPGTRLRIPYRTTKYVLLKEGESLQKHYAQAGKSGSMILHEMVRGETLSKVAKQYNVPVEVLMQWNDISDARRIRAGQQLALYIDHKGVMVKSGEENSGSATLAQADTGIPILSDTKKSPARGNRPPVLAAETTPQTVTRYRVRNGDSLWTIARKFKVSARDLRRWNNLRDNMIHPGSTLTIRNG